MPLVSNNLSPLPFYDSIEDWNHNSFQAFGDIHPLIVYRNFIPPFQIITPAINRLIITRIILVNYNTGKSANITDSMVLGGLKVIKHEHFNIISFYGLAPVTELTAEGRYYIRILGTNINYTSDIFSSRNNLHDCIKLEYSNPYNFRVKGGEVDFSDNFTFRCYLPTKIGYPDYQFEETVTNRMGYSYMESQVSKKTYQFVFTAPEYLCDALRIVRMCQTKIITDGPKVYDAINFNMEVDWQEQGNLAAVTCEFETDNVIANIGGLKLLDDRGDFNNDFNNDFSTE